MDLSAVPIIFSLASQISWGRFFHIFVQVSENHESHFQKSFWPTKNHMNPKFHTSQFHRAKNFMFFEEKYVGQPWGINSRGKSCEICFPQILELPKFHVFHIFELFI